MAKMRQLPITDLARISVLERSLRRPALEQVKEGGGRGSYRPTRKTLGDIVNRQPGVFSLPRPAWEVISSEIKKLSKNDVEEKMNLRSARAIYDYCEVEGVDARELEAFPLSFSVGLKLTCWSPALFVYPERIAIPFFDMRRTFALTPDAARFMMSVMHIALRESNPDYESVELEILRLTNTDARTVHSIQKIPGSLYSYEQLEEMVWETQNLWVDIQTERQDRRRRSGGKWGEGDLFG